MPTDKTPQCAGVAIVVFVLLIVLLFAPSPPLKAPDNGGILGARGGDTLVAWAMSYPINEPYTGQMSASAGFNGTAQGGTPPYSYTWTFGDGGSSTSLEATHVYTVAGAYIAVLTVTDLAGDVATSTVVPTPPFPVSPETSIDARPRLGPVPLTVLFDVFENLDGTWSYRWEFGDGGSSVARNPTHTFVRPGTYTVHLDVTTPQMGPEPYQMTIIATGDEAPKVLASYGNELSGTCEPFTQNVSFNSTAAAGTRPYSYRWDFADGGASTSSDPVHTYTWHSGPLSVNLTLMDANGSVATTSLSYNVEPPWGCPQPLGETPYVVVGAGVGAVAVAVAAGFALRYGKAKNP